MPVYVYECKTCGEELEIEHSIKEDALKSHPHRDDYLDRDCNGPLKRLIAGGTSFTWPGGAPTPKNYS